MKTSIFLSLGILAALLCTSATLAQIQLTVQDISLQTGLQDNEGFAESDHLKRGRASICADFNNDGLVDIYVGNPGDESYVLINLGNQGNGLASFAPSNLLLTGELAWGGAAADFDEDGDIDLFISIGGNEGSGFDYLFRNTFIETGDLSFVDITNQAGVAGPLGTNGNPIAAASANAIFVDYDRDGDLDLWVNTNELDRNQNVLWSNQLRETGQATFQNVTEQVGLAVATTVRTLHSSWADFDQDGDMDLYENNFRNTNRYMKNMLVETGQATFVDYTSQASLPGDDLAYPRTSFGSAVLDFNGDGFEDIFANFRFRSNPGNEPAESPYGNGHAIFLNDGTGRFTNAVSNTIKFGFPMDGGVMGFMVGDLNGDTYPEIFLGQGGPMIRQENQLFVSDGTLNANGFPNYEDASTFINFPSPESPEYPKGYYPDYPYRTHGTAFVDTNGDGNLEIHVANGGRTIDENTVRDPNRHFDLDWGPRNHFTVQLIGDGVNVNRDGVGARIAITVGTTGTNENRQIFRTVRAGNAFSAQNDIRSINFGLGTSDVVSSMEIVWSDGTIQTVNNGLAVNTKKLVTYGKSDVLPGDVNLDGTVNLLDVSPFIELLSSSQFQAEADINQDGSVNLLDVEPFVNILGN